MFNLYVENKHGDRMCLTDLDRFVCEYSGFNPPKATIFATDMAGMNGSKYISDKLNVRNIVLTFTLLRDIANARLDLYEFFTTGQYVKLYYEGTRQVWIEGYVETVSADQFKATPSKQIMQVSIVCHDPALTDEFEQEIVASSGTTYIDYEGDIESGFTIVATMSGAVSNPTFTDSNGHSMTISHNFVSGDVLTIVTEKGKKSVKVVNNNVTTNLIGYVTFASTFLTLGKGRNTITHSPTSNVSITYKFTNKYGAI